MDTSSVGRYHRLCATVSTVKKYRGTRYYRDFAITLTNRPAGIAGKGMGTVSEVRDVDVGVFIPQYFVNIIN